MLCYGLLYIYIYIYILLYIIWYDIILCYITLYYILFYYIILYFIILYYIYDIYLYIHDIYIYSIYRYDRRYSGIISNRRCCLGVRPNAFQIEDIAECKSSSNDQKSKNKPLNIGMIFGISSIWKSFVPLPFFVFFLQGNYLKSIEHWRPTWVTPQRGECQSTSRSGTRPEVLWHSRLRGGGVGEKLFKNHGFFSFFDWGMVIQTTFQIEDNL